MDANSSDFTLPEELPVLPMREMVVFPYMVLPIFVARERSIAAVEDVRELVEVGAYVAGTNAEADHGLAAMGSISTFLGQEAAETAPFDDSWGRLGTLIAELETEKETEKERETEEA